MKRFASLLLAILLLLGGCAFKPDAIKMSWEQSGEQDEEETESSSVEPSTNPLTAIMTPAPLETVPFVLDNAEDILYVSSEDVENIKSLWPLAEYPVQYFGELTFISIYLSDHSLFLTLDFDTGRPFCDVKAELQDYIVGIWEDKDGYIAIYGGTAEGSTAVDCTVFDNTDAIVKFSFTLSDGHAAADEFLKAHWPKNGIEMPAEMMGEPVSKYAALTPNMFYISFDWETLDNEAVFAELRESMSGQDGFTYTPGSDDSGEKVDFNIGDVGVQISLSEEFGSIAVTYSMYPDIQL